MTDTPSSSAPTPYLHPASCVADARGRAVLISGPSGSGKSSLCLLLMDRGFALVSDDQTALQVEHGQLIARAAPNIAGLIEVRNLGIIAAPRIAEQAVVSLALHLDVDAPRFIDAPQTQMLLDQAIPAIALCPDLATAAIKTEYALRVYGKTDYSGG